MVSAPDAAASQWLFDEHETQLDWDREQVRRVLGKSPSRRVFA